jgi:hypothetical protein
MRKTYLSFFLRSESLVNSTPCSDGRLPAAPADSLQQRAIPDGRDRSRQRVTETADSWEPPERGRLGREEIEDGGGSGDWRQGPERGRGRLERRFSGGDRGRLAAGARAGTGAARAREEDRARLGSRAEEQRPRVQAGSASGAEDEVGGGRRSGDRGRRSRAHRRREEEAAAVGRGGGEPGRAAAAATRKKKS